MRTDTPPLIRLKDYRASAYLITHVDLDFALHATETVVRARLSIKPNPAVGKTGEPLMLDGECLTLGAISLNGKPLAAKDYAVSDRTLVLHTPPARAFTLETTVLINPEANKALQGLYQSRGVFCTQCEAEGFRRITYFLDRPDILSTYEVRIEASLSQAPILLSNGNPAERGRLPGGRHFAVWKDPHPKPCYLFALVGGDLAQIGQTFKTASGRTVALKIYVEHGKEGRATWAMDSLVRSMRWDEVRFGREYDLDVFNIVAVSDFNMGAMENKGLNIFNDRLILASPETATDANFESIEAVVAHEYFHNWTGNRITCRDWFQLCLKEGLTVFRDQEFSADERSRTVQRIVDVRHLRATQFAEDAGPLAHPVRPESYIEINNFYTPTVYEKGAEVVRMLLTILGTETFERGLDLYFTRHDGHAATIEDFLACFEAVSGRDLAQFKLWYSQAGTPQLVASMRYDRRAKTAELAFEQVLAPSPGMAKKKPMHIPVRVGLLGSDGSDLPLTLVGGSEVDGGVLHITKRQQSFVFTDVSSPPVPSLLRGFSAPVSLVINASDEDLAFQIQHDRDLFNRWQAANTFATRTLVGMVRSLQKGERSSASAISFAHALRATLVDGNLEPAYLAELLRLPTQSDIAREIGKSIDPSAIHRAHRMLSKLVGTQLGNELEDLYRTMKPKGSFSPDAASAGRRALRNAALALLSARGSEADLARLAQHFFKANNMTDQAFAMMLIAGQRGPIRDKVLAHFFERWKNDHLVIDMWFSAQAQAPLAGALGHVKALTKHPLFSYAAPNKVRSLIGVFAMQNPMQFHRPDGAGYEFVAKAVLTIDPINPSIAARMIGAFKSWSALEPTRRAAAKRVLGSVAKAKPLSRDVYEIVTKMLDQ